MCYFGPRGCINNFKVKILLGIVLKHHHQYDFLLLRHYNIMITLYDTILYVFELNNFCQVEVSPHVGPVLNFENNESMTFDRHTTTTNDDDDGKSP